MKEDRNKESEREEHVHTRVFLTLHRTSTRKREYERVENMIQKKLIWRCAYSTQPDATSFGAYFGVDTHIFLDESISQNDVQCDTKHDCSPQPMGCIRLWYVHNDNEPSARTNTTIIIGNIRFNYDAFNFGERNFLRSVAVGGSRQLAILFDKLDVVVVAVVFSIQFKCIKHLKYFCRHAASVFVCMCSLTPSI